MKPTLGLVVAEIIKMKREIRLLKMDNILLRIEIDEAKDEKDSL